MDPSGRNERQRLALNSKSSRGARRQKRKPGLDSSDEEYNVDLALASTTVSQWDQKEDDILKENYVTYKDTGCYLDMLASLLEEKCNTKRAKSQIERRLVFLKLKNSERFTEKQMRAVHKRNMTTKPTFDDILQKRIESSVRGAGNSGPKKDGLDWLCKELSRCVRIREEFPKAKQTIAIVPVDREHFQHVRHKSVQKVMTFLNFQPPNLIDGTAFWRIPFVYTVKDMEDAQMYIRDGMDLEGIGDQADNDDDVNILPPDLDEMEVKEEFLMEPPEMEVPEVKEENVMEPPREVAEMKHEILMEPPEEEEAELDLTAPDRVLVSGDGQSPNTFPETIINESTANIPETLPLNAVGDARKRPFPIDKESSEQKDLVSKKKKRRLRVKEDSMDIQEEELDFSDL